jgi:hypothetical protein
MRTIQTTLVKFNFKQEFAAGWDALVIYSYLLVRVVDVAQESRRQPAPSATPSFSSPMRPLVITEKDRFVYRRSSLFRLSLRKEINLWAKLEDFY